MKPPEKIYVSQRTFDKPVDSMEIESYWCPSLTGTDIVYVKQHSELRRLERWIKKNMEKLKGSSPMDMVLEYHREGLIAACRNILNKIKKMRGK
jgi:hypothetical protein